MASSSSSSLPLSSSSSSSSFGVLTVLPESPRQSSYSFSTGGVGVRERVSGSSPIGVVGGLVDGFGSVRSASRSPPKSALSHRGSPGGHRLSVVFSIPSPPQSPERHLHAYSFSSNQNSHPLVPAPAPTTPLGVTALTVAGAAIVNSNSSPRPHIHTHTHTHSHNQNPSGESISSSSSSTSGSVCTSACSQYVCVSPSHAQKTSPTLVTAKARLSISRDFRLQGRQRFSTSQTGSSGSVSISNNPACSPVIYYGSMLQTSPHALIAAAATTGPHSSSNNSSSPSTPLANTPSSASSSSSASSASVSFPLAALKEESSEVESPSATSSVGSSVCASASGSVSASAGVHGSANGVVLAHATSPALVAISSVVRLSPKSMAMPLLTPRGTKTIHSYDADALPEELREALLARIGRRSVVEAYSGEDTDRNYTPRVNTNFTHVVAPSTHAHLQPQSPSAATARKVSVLSTAAPSNPVLGSNQSQSQYKSGAECESAQTSMEVDATKAASKLKVLNANTDVDDKRNCADVYDNDPSCSASLPPRMNTVDKNGKRHVRADSLDLRILQQQKQSLSASSTPSSSTLQPYATLPLPVSSSTCAAQSGDDKTMKSAGGGGAVSHAQSVSKFADSKLREKLDGKKKNMSERDKDNDKAKIITEEHALKEKEDKPKSEKQVILPVPLVKEERITLKQSNSDSTDSRFLEPPAANTNACASTGSATLSASASASALASASHSTSASASPSNTPSLGSRIELSHRTSESGNESVPPPVSSLSAASPALVLALASASASSVVHDGTGAQSSQREVRVVTFNLDCISTITTNDLLQLEHVNNAFLAHPHAAPKKGILKRRVRKETWNEVLSRIVAERERERSYVTYMSEGALFTKYGTNGKPMKRYFFVSPDGDEMSWDKAPADAHHNSFAHAGKESKPPPSPYVVNPKTGQVTKRSKKLFSSAFRFLPWKKPADRCRSLGDVIGCHYGPYASENFQRYLQFLDGAMGKPWLCFSIEFADRTIDLVCQSEEQVTQWFLGIQSLSPLSVHYLSHGALLWQRLIMKLNYFGLQCALTGQVKEREDEIRKEIARIFQQQQQQHQHHHHHHQQQQHHQHQQPNGK